MGFRKIPLTKVLDNVLNPRDFTQPHQRKALNRLINSIRENGLIELPILYRKKNSRFFGILSGHRRIHACRELGWAEVEFIWTKDRGLPEAMSDEEALKYIIVEPQQSWGPSGVLKSLGDAIDLELDIDVPDKFKNMMLVYGLAPGWLQDMMRKKSGKGRSIGWTVVKDILDYNLDEHEIEKWVEQYISKQFNQRGLREELGRYYGCKLDAVEEVNA